ncbi:LPXTG cell wall anchor domain-containing protein [Cryptosporangium aurantiacum]|nr:LPXTG cell wall anchor domain-containing protein [Cryptosporangium aurantiacum]
MNWSSGGTSWLEGLSAFGVLMLFVAGWFRSRRRRDRND